MKRIFNISIFFLIAASCFAQQDAQYNQYIFNELIINPAYAGTKEVINANAFFSKQWVGVDGSPCSESVSIDVPATEKMGLGLQIINEYIGAQLHQSLFGSYSYKLRINDNYKLSLGLALGASYYTLNGNDLTTATPDDPAVPKYIAHQLMPDAKTGLFFYGDRFYAGLSVTELLANVIKNDPFYVEQARNYFLTSGYVFDILPKLKFKPSILIKHSTTIPSTIDINALFRYDERFWIGASYRFGSKLLESSSLSNSLATRDGIVIMLDYNVNDKFHIGYAYSMTLSAFQNVTNHEISLGYFIPVKVPVKKMDNIRNF